MRDQVQVHGCYTVRTRCTFVLAVSRRYHRQVRQPREKEGSDRLSSLYRLGEESVVVTPCLVMQG